MIWSSFVSGFICGIVLVLGAIFAAMDPDE
jgi:hypothetical protein